jgi:hypothetical protein
MSSNVRLRSNVMVRGDARFGAAVRSAEAIRKWVLRSNPGLPENADKWTLLRHGHGLTPKQIVELAWATPCSNCGAIPEGLRQGAIEFHCPKQRCKYAKLPARLLLMTVDLFEKTKSFPGGRHDAVQAALEAFGAMYPRTERLGSRTQISLVVRIKRYQDLLYAGWTPREFSDHVELCLERLMQSRPDAPR